MSPIRSRSYFIPILHRGRRRQREREGTCPRSDRKPVVEPGYEHRFPEPPFAALTTKLFLPPLFGRNDKVSLTWGALQGLSFKVLNFMWKRCSRQETSLLWRASCKVFVCLYQRKAVTHAGTFPFLLGTGFYWSRKALEYQECGVWLSWAFLWKPQAWEVLCTFAPTCGYLHCGAQLIAWWSVQGRAIG